MRRRRREEEKEEEEEREEEFEKHTEQEERKLEPSSLPRRPNKTSREFENPQTAPMDSTCIGVHVMVSFGLSSR